MSWLDRWLKVLDDLGYEQHLRRGRSYARKGLVKALEVQVGLVTAQVEDRDRGLCEVEIHFNSFDDETWHQLFDALAGQAIYVAQLLAGDLPASIEALFGEQGAPLLPGGHYDMEARCKSCEAWEQPCKHTAAVLYLLGQVIEDDPWLLLRLRGRDRQQVLQALRQRRQEDDPTPIPQTAPAAPEEGVTIGGLTGLEGSLPLSAQLDLFWGEGGKLADLHHFIAPPSVRLALLRRLGRPPFAADSIETYDALAQIYAQVSDQALTLAYAPEPETEE